jgi:8-oxo-dGTP pyrophosphatase MutT (NUDIX family)
MGAKVLFPRQLVVVPTKKGTLNLRAAVTLHRCAGGIVIRRSNDFVEFLLLKQIRKTGEVQWVMPKGHIQKGETSERAAIREAREEAGLEELRLIACLGKQEFRYREEHGIQHKKVVSRYLMETPYESHLSIKAEEGIIKAMWLPLEETRKQCSLKDFRESVDKAAKALGLRKNQTGI